MSFPAASPPASALRARFMPTAKSRSIDPEGEIAGFCDSTDAWLPLLCTMNVTVATEAVRNLFGWSVRNWTARLRACRRAPTGFFFFLIFKANARRICRAAAAFSTA